MTKHTINQINRAMECYNAQTYEDKKKMREYVRQQRADAQHEFNKISPYTAPEDAKIRTERFNYYDALLKEMDKTK